MKTKCIFIVVAIVLGVYTTTLAQSPHFLNSRTRVSIDSEGDLVACFKEAGLGDNLLIDYLLSADVTVTCTCVNNSGRCPKAANKVTFSESEAVPGEFNSGKNGTISACLELSPPPCPPSDPPTCGNGQSLALSAISYTNISLEDVTDDIFANVPETLSTAFFTCP